MGFTKILVAVDFSAPSRQALQRACALANDAKAQLGVMHVWQVPVLGAELPLPAEYIEDLRINAEKQLAASVDEASMLVGHPVTSIFEVGQPWDQVMRRVQADGYDLVVVGTHGHTGLKHVLLGSVAERIVRHAPCAVLVVR